MNEPTVISGDRRTGKTTKLVEYILDYKRANPRGQVLISVPNGNRLNHLLREIEYAGMKFTKFDAVIVNNIDVSLMGRRGGLLAIDDFDVVPFGLATKILNDAKSRDFAIVYTGDFG